VSGSVNELPPSRTLIRFGVFELNTETGELLKHGSKVRLQEQPFQILRILLEHHGKVVTREELQHRIWPADTFVDFDRGLYNAIKKLREALGDDAEKPRFIETLSKRGYRFIASVQSGAPPAPAEALTLPPTSTQSDAPKIRRQRFASGWLWVTSAAVAVILVLALNPSGVRDRLLGKTVTLRIQSIAVLPLANLSGDPAQEYFSDGMTDALITDLAQIGSVKVISRTSIMGYKETAKRLPEIARELKVDGIVEGTVQRSGDRVRITAQLIHAPSDRHLWANSYERDLRDVFILEREVARDVARQVQAHVTIDKQGQLAQPRPVDPRALEAYLRGNSHMHKFSRGFGDEELSLASEDFSRAIEAEPDFAAAYVGMSRARHGTFRSSSEDEDIARKAAQRAVELDPNLSDAWTTLADIRCDFWEWPEAERDYRRALAINPSDATAHEHFGFVLDALGRLDEGWKEAEIAQQLDPNEDHLEPALGNRHEYDQIIQHITTMLEADPNNGYLHYGLFEGYKGKGMYKEAVEQLEQTLVLTGFQESAAKVRQAFAASGYEGAMREFAKEFEYLHANNQVFMPINLAEAYTAAGDKDRAFYWLEQAYSRRGHGNAGVFMVFLNRDPFLELLHTDPRYKDLLRRVGLPP